jgi:leader peptidase (prepilin peptidase) / N-methyltransferase
MTDYAPTIAPAASNTTRPRRRDKWSVAAGAVVALLFAAVGSPAIASFAALVCVTPMIIAADVHDRRIPTPLIHASALILATSIGVTAAGGQPSRALHATIGLVVVGGAFLSAHLVSPRGMGYGDVRLAALTGTAVAYGTNVSAAVACAVVAAAASGVWCLSRREQSAPFAAFVLPIALVTNAVVAVSL